MEEKKYFIVSNKNILRKSLFSEIKPVKKPFRSIMLCRQKEKEEVPDRNITYVESQGLLIVRHPEEILKHKKEFFNKTYWCKGRDENKERRGKYNRETELLWEDLNHPKIMRHYSKC